MRCYFAALLVVSATLGVTLEADADNIDARPLWQAVSTELKPVKAGKLRVPTITWPGDVRTVYGVQGDVFKGEGLDVELFLENDLTKQVQGCLNGDTPFIRGELGMINAAAEAFKKAGTDLVVIEQLTFSTGGDCLVVREEIKKLEDLKGKRIGLQLYGPHMGFATTILNRAGLKPTDVTFVWFKELTIPSYDTKQIVDPRTAFTESNDLDAVFVISPDAAALTSAEGRKGAKILFSSKTASTIIADCYAVRGDWFNQNRTTVEKFTHALMRSTEGFQALVANKATESARFQQLMTKSAEILFGTPAALGDVQGSLGDATWVGFKGNVQFFTGTGTTRNFAVMTDEIQTSFQALGLIGEKVVIRQAEWDYNKLATDLKDVDLAAIPKPSFNVGKLQSKAEQNIKTELENWETEGSLYSFEIYFQPNQKEFSVDQYAVDFKKVLELSQTFGGAVVFIEGHNSPDLIEKLRAEGVSEADIKVREQAARNVSLSRANAVRKAYFEFCSANGLATDESQFIAVGLGVKVPKDSKNPRNPQNRRVIFRLRNVETELE